MIRAEFEERSYEGPLYNQLERGQRDIWSPGQVLESCVGFDHGLQLTRSVIWETLGYDAPLPGLALAYYDWLPFWGPRHPRRQLPRFKLNLFLQAKRPNFHKRKPRSLRSTQTINAPLWAFRITRRQQRLLEVLARKTSRLAHVAYAAPTFHTLSELYCHTQRRTIVQNSTFPSATALTGHDGWYYQRPGASGTANPDPELIEETELLPRLRAIARQSENAWGDGLEWLDALAENVIEAVELVGAAEAAAPVEALSALYFNDLHTLDRLSEIYNLRRTFKAYAQVMTFSIRFDLNWLVLTDSE